MSRMEHDHITATSSLNKSQRKGQGSVLGGRQSGLVSGGLKRETGGIGQSEMYSSQMSPLKQGTHYRPPDSGLQKTGMRETDQDSEMNSRDKKKKIMDEMEEDATGEYNRKGEVDRKALLAGSSIA